VVAYAVYYHQACPRSIPAVDHILLMISGRYLTTVPPMQQKSYTLHAGMLKPLNEEVHSINMSASRFALL